MTFSPPVFAKPRATPQDILKQEAEIPKAPTVPTPIERPAPRIYNACQRKFVHEGEAKPCDSPSQVDGEKLRPLLQDVPQAALELDEYQINRRALNRTAYFSTIGLTLALIGNFLNRGSNNSEGGTSTGTYLVFSGMTLAGLSVAYGWTASRANDRHLYRAVEYYNQAKPEHPIELKFSSDFNLK